MTNNDREIRTFNLELRAKADESPKIGGYAALFNSDSVVMWDSRKGEYVEQITPGAFSECLDDDVRLLFNHDANYVLARTKSGSLKIEQDEVGLRFEAELDESDPDAKRVLSKVRRGDVDQCSFAFYVEDQEWVPQEDGSLRRYINRIKDLFDVSVVTEPAYPATSAYARSVADAYKEVREGKTLTEEEVDVLKSAQLDSLIPEVEEPEAVEVQDTEPEETVAETENKLELALLLLTALEEELLLDEDNKKGNSNG